MDLLKHMSQDVKLRENVLTNANTVTDMRNQKKILMKYSNPAIFI